MAKRVSDKRIAEIMKRSVQEEMENWKSAVKMPIKAGPSLEISSKINPSTTWTTEILAYGPFSQGTAQVLNFSSSVPATRANPIKIEAIGLYVSASLSSSIYVDKVGIKAPGAQAGEVYGEGLKLSVNDPVYFFTSSVLQPSIRHFSEVYTLVVLGSSLLIMLPPQPT